MAEAAFHKKFIHMKKETQLSVIREALLDGQVVTPIDALNMCGCFRLSAIIHTLRHKEGLPINAVLAEGPRYDKYFIEEHDLADLRERSIA